MTTPDYLEQVVISNRRRRSRSAAKPGGKSGTLPVTGIVWAVMDFLSGLVAGLIAYRIHVNDMVQDSRLLAKITQDPPFVVVGSFLLFNVYLVFFARMYGLYRMDNKSGLHEQRMTIQATATAGLLLCGTLYVWHAYDVSRMVVLLTVLLTMGMLMVRRALWRKLRQRRYLQGQETRNVLIVGDGRVGHALRNHLESLPHMGFRFKGFVALDERSEISGNPQVISNVRNCVAVARSLFVDEIYFSTPANKDVVMQVVEEARALDIEVRVVPDLYDGLAWNAPVEFIGQFPTIPLHRGDFPRGAFMMKRVMDVTLSSLALLVTSPVLLVIALMVRMDSSGPIFYKAERIGRKGRVFKCYKFRTMVPNADKMRKDMEHLNEREDILFKVSNDPRITRTGARLRKYSLDELPQFWNVLKGDMSLVGPRPPLAAEVAKYDIAHLRRLDVLPGMTGLWQVEARQDPSFDSYISLDTAYVENWNLMLDLRILARTLNVVVSGTGS